MPREIYELKKFNAELEKFKFVLDYKIKELKAQIDPKNEDIAAMKRIIQGMDADLETYHRKNKLLQQDIASLQKKQLLLQKEILLQRKRVADAENAEGVVMWDLHSLLEATTSMDTFRKKFTDMASRYSGKYLKTNSGESTEDFVDSEIYAEYERQKDYLERSVRALKKKLQKDSSVHKQDNQRAMLENISLIKNINELRKEILFLQGEQAQKKLNQQ